MCGLGFRTRSARKDSGPRAIAFPIARRSEKANPYRAGRFAVRAGVWSAGAGPDRRRRYRSGHESIASDEKDAGHFGFLGAGRWRFQPKMYLKVCMPDKCNYRTYASPKIEPKKIKGYCTTCARNRKLTSWIPRCCSDRPTRRIPRLPTHGGRRGRRRLELPHRCADSCPRRAAPGAGIPPRLALAGGLRAMTANDLFSTACRDRARPRSAWDALPCAALPPPGGL